MPRTVPAFRIVKRRHADHAFDGEGARRFGGRWSPPGTRAVYASGSIALALLELVVHLGAEEPLAGYVVFALEIPEAGIETLDPRRLPRGWRASPPPPACQRLGRSWLESRRAAVLRVPSAVVPEEPNYLLAPGHPAFGRIRISRPHPLALDPRLC